MVTLLHRNAQPVFLGLGIFKLYGLVEAGDTGIHLGADTHSLHEEIVKLLGT